MERATGIEPALERVRLLRRMNPHRRLTCHQRRTRSRHEVRAHHDWQSQDAHAGNLDRQGAGTIGKRFGQDFGFAEFAMINR